MDEKIGSLEKRFDEKLGSLERRFPAVQEMAEIKARLGLVEGKLSPR